jgi:hypothetical protein
VKVTLSSSNYQSDVNTGLTALGIKVQLGTDPSSPTLTCTKDSGPVFHCPLGTLGDSPLASTPVSISYLETTDFAANSNASLNLVIAAIPVQVDKTQLVWIDASNIANPFPEVMHCVHCSSGAFPDRYFIFYGSSTNNQSYHITVPVNLDLPSGKTIPNITTVDGGQVTITFKSSVQGQSITLPSTSVSGGVASFTYNLNNNLSNYAFGFNEIDLGYLDTGGAFGADTQSVAYTTPFYYVPRVTFAMGDFSSAGFNVTGLPSNICFRVYFENETSSTTCEGEACWQTDWPRDTSGNLQNNNVMADCGGQYIPSAANDGSISIAGSTAWEPSNPNNKYQIYVQAWIPGSSSVSSSDVGSPWIWPSNFFGYLKQGWPP